MSKKEAVLVALSAFFVILFAYCAAFWLNKPNNANRFNLSNENIIKDLDGRAVNLVMNQVWPFDLSQNIEVQVIAKKPSDEFVVVVVEVKAIAPVQQADTTPKEQFSTTTTSKDVPRTPAKLPTKLRLAGRMKLTYELIDNEWYLLVAENLNLRAIPME